MNSKIKAMCLELAEKALTTKDVSVNVRDFAITIIHLEDGKEEFSYYVFILFDDTDVEQRLQHALDYVKNLGGNENEKYK